jgi:hypothetical protein
MSKERKTPMGVVEVSTWNELLLLASEVYKHSCDVLLEAKALRVELKGDMPEGTDEEGAGQGSGFACELRRLLNCIQGNLDGIQDSIRDMK